jgi:hypothetical protein
VQVLGQLGEASPPSTIQAQFWLQSKAEQAVLPHRAWQTFCPQCTALQAPVPTQVSSQTLACKHWMDEQVLAPSQVTLQTPLPQLTEGQLPVVVQPMVQLTPCEQLTVPKQVRVKQST